MLPLRLAGRQDAKVTFERRRDGSLFVASWTP